jgi:hypothetical protein
LAWCEGETDPRRFRLFYLTVDTSGNAGGVSVSPALPMDPLDEKGREVRLRHYGNDPVVFHLNALQDQSREIIPLLGCCRRPCGW